MKPTPAYNELFDKSHHNTELLTEFNSIINANEEAFDAADRILREDYENSSEKEALMKKAQPFYDALDAIGWQNIEETKIGELFDKDSPLFKAYPNLKNVDVVYYLAGNFNAAFTEDNELVLLGGKSGLNDNGLRGVLYHEVQHYAQSQEGFAQGTAPMRHKEWRTSVTAQLKQKRMRYLILLMAKRVGRNTNPESIPLRRMGKYTR